MTQCKHQHTQVIESGWIVDGQCTRMGFKKFSNALSDDLEMAVIRRRKCKNCGHKFSTLEIPASHLSGLVHVSKAKKASYLEIIEHLKQLASGKESV